MGVLYKEVIDILYTKNIEELTCCFFYKSFYMYKIYHIARGYMQFFMITQ